MVKRIVNRDYHGDGSLRIAINGDINDYVNDVIAEIHNYALFRSDKPKRIRIDWKYGVEPAILRNAYVDAIEHFHVHGALCGRQSFLHPKPYYYDIEYGPKWAKEESHVR
jgi:hypothetical protein